VDEELLQQADVIEAWLHAGERTVLALELLDLYQARMTNVW